MFRSMFFGNKPSADGGPSRGQPDQTETLSASVNLEDIIDNFDRVSRKSKSASVASFLNSQLLSQTYFSALGTTSIRDDETTSFYSALQDGFSLGDHQLACNTNPAGGQDNLLWGDSDEQHNESDFMLPKPNFEVFWSDLSYTIKPKITLSSLWLDLEQYMRSSIPTKLSMFNKPQDYESAQNHKKEPITIIQQINGSFKSGELTAVMGPSGAGKTSLLNFLSRRREDGYTGQLYVDNSYRRIKISTIPQNDLQPEYLTVKENLLFASRLKNQQKNYDHEKNVIKVSSLLGLDHCLDTMTKKISGGQHKRLSIAQELLSKPDILILDEPTSGLDSLTCYKTLTVLKNLVKSSAMKLIDPIAIVLTIHQPQLDVFDIFDKVYVMANQGIAIYDGPPEKCTEFIEKHSGIRMPDEDYNPASFLIEIASGEYGAEPIKALEYQVKLQFAAQRDRSTDKVSRLKQEQVKSNDRGAEHIVINQDTKQTDKMTMSDSTRRRSFLYIDQRIAKGSSMNKGNFWSKTCILSKRYWTSIIRDPKQMIARILFHIFLPIGLAMIMGTEPGQSNACPRYKPQYELQDLVKNDSLTSDAVQEELLLTLENMSLLFVMIYALTSASIGAITLSFTLDMQSSLKEYHNGWYSMPSYIFSRILTDIPMDIGLPVLTLVIGYPLSGQISGDTVSSAYRVFLTAVAVILGSMVGTTMGMIFGAIYIGHVSTALFAAQGATLPLVFLSGFVVRTKNMSKFVYALSHLSFIRHTLEIAVVARYGFSICGCDPRTISGKKAEIVGVPDRLRSYMQYWVASQGEPSDTSLADADNANTTTDIFQMFARQISLYNTYGLEIKSCQDIKPYQLHELSLNESDLPSTFLALVILLILVKIMLFITVKIVIHFKTSL